MLTMKINTKKKACRSKNKKITISLNWSVIADRTHLEPENPSGQEKQYNPAAQSLLVEHSSRSYGSKLIKNQLNSNVMTLKQA